MIIGGLFGILDINKCSEYVAKWQIVENISHDEWKHTEATDGRRGTYHYSSYLKQDRDCLKI